MQTVQKTKLGLQLPTDPRWVDLADKEHLNSVLSGKKVTKIIHLAAQAGCLLLCFRVCPICRGVPAGAFSLSLSLLLPR